MLPVRMPQGKPDKHVWWRVEIRSYSVIIDADRDEYRTSTYIELHWFEVLRLTPKGAWLKTEPFSTVLQHNRWCARVARKRFACPTPAEAIESALARRTRRLSILKRQAAREQNIVHKLAQIAGDFDRGYGPEDLR